jgi:predicted nucleic acid-binding protein
MLRAPFRVVLDACVLFPYSLRDTLLRAADAAFYQLYWSAEILDEMTRNLVAKGTTTDEKAASLAKQMNSYFPEAMISGHEPLIAAMKNDAKDRHVAAAAVKAGAQVVVTSNLKDFRELPDGIEAQSPDDFLCNLFDLDPQRMCELIREQADDMKNPPRSFEQLLGGLAKIVPEFAKALATWMATQKARSLPR